MDKKVEEYISKQKSPQKEIVEKLRKIILKTIPKAKEEMKWGAIVYAGGKFYVGVVKYGVNLGFAIKGLLKEEINEFEGSGRAMRHIKILSTEDIDQKKLIKLIMLVSKKATCDEKC